MVREAFQSLLKRIDPLQKMPKKRESKTLTRQKDSNDILSIADRMKARTRYIPMKIKQEIWRRDKGECTYVSPIGKQCQEKGFLHLDHIEPWALGGTSDPENLRLLCASHNLRRSEKTFTGMIHVKGSSIHPSIVA